MITIQQKKSSDLLSAISRIRVVHPNYDPSCKAGDINQDTCKISLVMGQDHLAPFYENKIVML